MTKETPLAVQARLNAERDSKDERVLAIKKMVDKLRQVDRDKITLPVSSWTNLSSDQALTKLSRKELLELTLSEDLQFLIDNKITLHPVEDEILALSAEFNEPGWVPSLERHARKASKLLLLAGLAFFIATLATNSVGWLRWAPLCVIPALFLPELVTSKSKKLAEKASPVNSFIPDLDLY